MARWTWVVATLEGEELCELTEAKSRKLKFPLRDAATATFTIDGRHWQAGYIAELRTDLVVYRDGVRLYRGRVGSTDDDIDADGHTVNCSSVDYRGMLGTRIIPQEIVFPEWATGDIAINLMDWAQNDVNGNRGTGDDLGIRRGNVQPLGARAGHVTPADTFADKAIDELATGLGGFEWWVDTEKRFNVVYQRGTERPDFPLALGTTVTKVRRQVDTTQYGNRMRVRGGRPEGAAQDAPEVWTDLYAPDLHSRVEKRIDRLHSNADLKTQEMVNASARYELSRAGNIVPSYSMELRNDIEWWSPTQLWVGDRVDMHIRSGRVDVHESERCEDFEIDVDDSGTETVSVTLGRTRSDLLAWMGAMPERLERLERPGARAGGGAQGPAGPPGAPGAPGGLQGVQGSVASPAQLPPSGTVGQAWIAGGRLYVWRD